MTDLTIHNDPPVSEEQRKAMYAAAEGHSTLGIPQAVGREFVKEDAAEPGERWITINGAKVLVNGSGEVVGGAGGKFTGQKLEELGGKSEEQVREEFRKMQANKPAKKKGEEPVSVKEKIPHQVVSNFIKSYPTIEKMKARLKENSSADLKKAIEIIDKHGSLDSGSKMVKEFALEVLKSREAKNDSANAHVSDFIHADADVRADNAVAAGIAYCADGEYLLVQRGHGGDYPGHWAFPGGHIEQGESSKDAAIREFQEETGHLVADAVLVGGDGHFNTFYSAGPKFDVQMCDESTGAIWTTLDTLPEPMHPGVLAVLATEEFRRHGMNELGIAKAMADGALSSPQQYGNVTLFDLRITGTGVAYRSANEEYTWRNPDDYLNAEFLARCNGLPVIYVHPEKGLLDSIEFSERIVGTVLLPYISDNEVWGIAKIYDDAAIAIMTSGQMSTSPSVVTSGDAKLVLADGQECLVEGKPKIVDHLAICEIGVWDKGGPPAGVNSNQAGASTMNEDEIKAKADADAKEKEELQAKLDSALSELQEMKQAKADAEEKAKADECAKKDEEEKAKADSAIAAQIKALEARIPTALSDADMNAIGAAQAKADSIFSAFGVAAPKPIHGEGPGAYRRRLAASLKEHSQTYKDIDLAKADDALFGIAEAAIYADAAAAATRPATAAAGELRMRTRRTDAGHTVNEWAGDSGAYMRDFAMRPAHARINRPTH